MKIHVGTDTRGLMHSLTTTDAGQHDRTQLPHPVHGQEWTLYGDKAYYKAEDELHWEAASGRYRVNKNGKRTARGDATWARGEHAFQVVKRLWGFANVRYRGLAKNTTRAFAALALANLYLVRKQLPPQGT